MEVGWEVEVDPLSARGLVDPMECHGSWNVWSPWRVCTSSRPVRRCKSFPSTSGDEQCARDRGTFAGEGVDPYTGARSGLPISPPSVPPSCIGREGDSCRSKPCRYGARSPFWDGDGRESRFISGGGWAAHDYASKWLLTVGRGAKMTEMQRSRPQGFSEALATASNLQTRKLKREPRDIGYFFSPSAFAPASSRTVLYL